ncbi:hypothetical protein Dsin_022566 [Dipteronia sinensis]|uniref:DUF4220 domain-containing protein n=1 Tax=Dipteronia sinensis TaxID=43782 RepID=A0AAE0E023_9ROSI|nr:hypothetical protein Dsin_022566 [Dipteronia sinensis]
MLCISPAWINSGDSMLKEPDPGPNYAKLMDDIASKKEVNLPTTLITIEEQSGKKSNTRRSLIGERDGLHLGDLQVVHYAYHFFDIFKGTIVDLIFSFHERNESRDFFINLSPEDAFRVIEVELKFIYDALYSKDTHICEVLSNAFPISMVVWTCLRTQLDKIVPQGTSSPLPPSQKLCHWEIHSRYLSHEPLTKPLWILEKKDYRDKLLPFVIGVTFDESLLLWHIATELLYQTEEDATHEDGNSNYDYLREFSKILSDYMLYLLVVQRTMISVEAGTWKIRFRDTCAKAKRLFRSKNLGANEEKEACEEILGVNAYVEPVKVKGDRSKSVLFDASMLVCWLKF